MDDRNILDAPEPINDELKIPIRSVILTGLGICVSIFLIIHFGDFIAAVFGRPFTIWIFKYDPVALALIILSSFCFYFFLSSIRFSRRHWFRIMTVSITIVFISILINLFLFRGGLLANITYVFVKRLVFISLILGAGCSMANLFLVKKQYLIFSAIIIFTFLFLLLADYI